MKKTAAQLRAENARLKKQLAALKQSTPKQSRSVNVGKLLQKQKENRAKQRLQDRAESATNKFRPRKTDRNSIVFVGRDGKREPGKGRKGYAISVNTRGKKKLLKDYKKGFKPVKLIDLNIPLTQDNVAKVTKFYRGKRRVALGQPTLPKQLIKPLSKRQREKLLKQESKKFQKNVARNVEDFGAITKESGIIHPPRVNDFGDKVVGEISKSLKKAFDSSVGQREYIVTVLFLIRVPGERQDKVYEVVLQIGRPDHLEIEQGGIANFVYKKIYSLLAKQLAFDGYVTTGSANHVRHLKENEDREQGEWTKDHIAWESRHDTTTVHIQQIEWKIEQMI